jgi:tetratricopeptide (TPR) repeat protein
MRIPKSTYFIALTCAFLLGRIAGAGQVLDSSDQEILQKYKASQGDLNKGIDSFKKEKYDKAEESFLKVLERLPVHSEASYFLAQVYYKQGHLEKGLETIQNAESNFAVLGRILYRRQLSRTDQLNTQRQQIQQEITQLEAQLAQAKTDSERSAIQQQINQKQSGLGTPEMVQERQDQVETLTVPGDYYYVHGNLFFKMKKYQEALDLYLKAIEASPKHGNAYNNIANLYFMSQQYEKALEYLEKAEANGAKVNPEFKKAVLKALGR